jgi:hypothetical protein
MWWHGGAGLTERSERGTLSAVATHDLFCILFSLLFTLGDGLYSTTVLHSVWQAQFLVGAANRIVFMERYLEDKTIDMSSSLPLFRASKVRHPSGVADPVKVKAVRKIPLLNHDSSNFLRADQSKTACLGKA